MTTNQTDDHRAAAGPDRERLLRWLGFGLLALLFVVVTLVRIRLLTVPLERDEGEYAYLGQLLLQGQLPYQAAYTMKLPGTHACYALAMLLFGQTAAGVHAGLLVVTTLSAGMVFLLGRRLGGDLAAAVAGAVYLVLAVSGTVLGTFAHATQYVVCFALAGLLLYCRWSDRPRPPVLLVSGLLFGLALLMKQHGLFFAAVPLTLLLCPPVGAVRERRLANAVLFVVGVLLPLFLLVLYYAAAGSLGKLVFWTVSYASAYTGTIPPAMGWQVFKNQFADVTVNTAPFWLLAAAGVIGVLVRPPAGFGRRLPLLLMVAAVAAIVPGFHFRPHYFVQALPVVALLAGLAVATLPRLVPSRWRTVVQLLLLVLVAGAAGRILYAERSRLFQLPPEEVVKASYQTAKPFAESAAVADFIRENSAPTDKIMVIGSEPQIYFYARRPAATGYIYLYGLLENQRYAALMQDEFLREMTTAAPKFVVVVHDLTTWMSDGTGPDRFMANANRYLAENYVQVGVVDIFRNEPSRFVWGRGAALYRSSSSTYMLVLLRKDQLSGAGG